MFGDAKFAKTKNYGVVKGCLSFIKKGCVNLGYGFLMIRKILCWWSFCQRFKRCQ